jgi:hypothetical protein
VGAGGAHGCCGARVLVGVFPLRSAAQVEGNDFGRGRKSNRNGGKSRKKNVEITNNYCCLFANYTFYLLFFYRPSTIRVIGCAHIQISYQPD